jgi:hypothetical protein
VSADSYSDITAAVTRAQEAELEDSARSVLGEVRTAYFSSTELEDSARSVLGEVRTAYFSSTGLQQLTGVPASTWRYWAINGIGPRSFKLGRRRVWRKTDVLAWIEQQDVVTGTGGA